MGRGTEAMVSSQCELLSTGPSAGQTFPLEDAHEKTHTLGHPRRNVFTAPPHTPEAED